MGKNDAKAMLWGLGELPSHWGAVFGGLVGRAVERCRPQTAQVDSCLAALRRRGDFRPDELEEFKEAFALFDDSGAGAIEVRATNALRSRAGNAHSSSCTHTLTSSAARVFHRAASSEPCCARSASRRQKRMSRRCRARPARP